MSAAEVVARLAWVKPTGDDRWAAVCPAHPDGRPSLSIRELADGRVLLHCFAGCAANDVLAAIGLQLSDLFPKPLTDRSLRGERVPFVGSDVLRSVASEVILGVLWMGAVGRGEMPSDYDRRRAMLAGQRVLAALDTAIPAKDRRAEYVRAVRIAREDIPDEIV